MLQSMSLSCCSKDDELVLRDVFPGHFALPERRMRALRTIGDRPLSRWPFMYTWHRETPLRAPPSARFGAPSAQLRSLRDLQPVPREGARSACTPAARREAGLQRSADSPAERREQDR